MAACQTLYEIQNFPDMISECIFYLIHMSLCSNAMQSRRDKEVIGTPSIGYTTHLLDYLGGLEGGGCKKRADT